MAAAVEDELARVQRLREVGEKEAGYKAVVDAALARRDADGVMAVVRHLLHREAADQTGRTYTCPAVLGHVVRQVGRTPAEDGEDGPAEADCLELEEQLALAQRLVAEMRPKGDDFPTELMRAVRLLAEAYQGEGSFRKAAQALTSFEFDGWRSPVEAAPRERLEWHVMAAQFFLEVDESGPASQAIKRAHQFASEAPRDSELYVLFKTCYARVQDAQRNFLSAAREYARIAQFYGLVDEGALVEALKFAVTCAILAPAGPERTRLLATLYADERAPQLSNYAMLEKMLKDRITRNDEVKKFEKMLAAHQNATLAGGDTVLGKAVKEHNVRAASRLYNTIRFTELGVMLGISSDAAEALVRKMIENDQVEGATIDQVEGLVEFERGAGALKSWDKQINDTCRSVNDALEAISKRYPQYEY